MHLYLYNIAVWIYVHLYLYNIEFLLSYIEGSAYQNICWSEKPVILLEYKSNSVANCFFSQAFRNNKSGGLERKWRLLLLKVCNHKHVGHIEYISFSLFLKYFLTFLLNNTPKYTHVYFNVYFYFNLS